MERGRTTVENSYKARPGSMPVESHGNRKNYWGD